MKIEAVVYDLDGTLIDSVERAFETIRKIFDFSGIASHPTYAEFCEWYGPPWTNFYHDRGVTLSREEIFKLYNELAGHGQAELFPDVLDHLRAINRMKRFKVGMITAQRHSVVEERLATLGIGRYFKFVHTECNDKSAALIKECAELHVARESTIYIGDFAHDMRDARRAGVLPIGITRSWPTREVLMRAGAHQVIDHLDELPLVLKALLNGEGE